MWKKSRNLLCKLGLHAYEHVFTPCADQPFADDPMCVTEGRHTLECKDCGKEKSITRRKRRN